MMPILFQNNMKHIVETRKLNTTISAEWNYGSFLLPSLGCFLIFLIFYGEDILLLFKKIRPEHT